MIKTSNLLKIWNIYNQYILVLSEVCQQAVFSYLGVVIFMNGIAVNKTA